MRWLQQQLSENMDLLLKKVETELARYEHPLFCFSAVSSDPTVRLTIDLRPGLGVEHRHEIMLSQREIENPQFPWTFQKLLYDYLHEIVVEMFERNPQMRG